MTVNKAIFCSKIGLSSAETGKTNTIEQLGKKRERNMNLVQKNVEEGKVLKSASGKGEMGSGYNYPNEL